MNDNDTEVDFWPQHTHLCMCSHVYPHKHQLSRFIADGVVSQVIGRLSMNACICIFKVVIT